jgi:hypothetical protein
LLETPKHPISKHFAQFAVPLTPACLAMDEMWLAHAGPMSCVGEIKNSQPWAMSV